MSVQNLVIEIAKSWLGTPYRHQGSLKGVGCDCLGLVRGIWRELYGNEPAQAGPYSQDWAECGGADAVLDAAKTHFLSASEMTEGTLLVFRWKPEIPAKHLGIYVGEQRFIHAYERHSVIASPLVPSWQRRIAGVFNFPEIQAGD